MKNFKLNKIFLFVTSIYLLLSCGYQPILNKDNQNFSISKFNLEGNKRIAGLLKNNLIESQYKILDQLSIAIHEKYNNLSLTIGIAEQINDSYFPNLYNSIALIENGKWSIIARKIILPNYEVFDEKRYFRSANKVSLLSKKINEKTWKI